DRIRRDRGAPIETSARIDLMGAMAHAVGNTILALRRIPAQPLDARTVANWQRWVIDPGSARIACRRYSAFLYRAAVRARHKERDHGRRGVGRGGAGEQSDPPD